MSKPRPKKIYPKDWTWWDKHVRSPWWELKRWVFRWLFAPYREERRKLLEWCRDKDGAIAVLTDQLYLARREIDRLKGIPVADLEPLDSYPPYI